MIADTERSSIMLTKRRMPIPAKTTLAGENTWEMTIGSLIPG
jgi:hypothetical protein